jgi:hypothetical protein
MTSQKRRYWKHKTLINVYAHITGQDKCASCGTVENLQWDHIEPSSKSMLISQYIFPMKKLAQEVLKCQRLCHPCHIKKTRSEGSWKGCGPGGGRKAIPDTDWACKNCGNTERSFNYKGYGYCKPCHQKSKREHMRRARK